MKMKLLAFSVIGLLTCLSLKSQTLDEKYADDVKSIDAIMNAYYEVISGASSDPWQFERDKHIHSPNAVITRLGENGNADSHTLEAEYNTHGTGTTGRFLRKGTEAKDDSLRQYGPSMERL